jgi:hypothetical protein
MKAELEAIDSIISIVGGAYFQPIADLVERLRAMPSPEDANEIHATRRENGYAASVCLLSVVAFESFLARARHLKRGKARGGLAVFEELYPTYPNHDEILEVFVMRDLLAHNHLWEIGFTWDADGPLHMMHATHVSGGDSKHRQCVDAMTRRTKRLRVHTVPTRVDRRDAALVLKTVWDALEFMDADNRTVCPASPAYVHDGTGLIPFAELVRRFCEDTNEGLPIA